MMPRRTGKCFWTSRREQRLAAAQACPPAECRRHSPRRRSPLRSGRCLLTRRSTARAGGRLALLRGAIEVAGGDVALRVALDLRERGGGLAPADVHHVRAARVEAAARRRVSRLGGVPGIEISRRARARGRGIEPSRPHV